jgi:hypothetical protein
MSATEAAFRRGVAQAMHFACDEAERSQTAKAARRRLGMACAIADELRCDRDYSSAPPQ